MNIPKGATHKWTPYDFFTKRAGGQTWAVWQDEQWLWIGDDLGGEIAASPDPHAILAGEVIRQMAAVISTCVSNVEAAEALYDAGYRKFEIVEEDV